MKALHFGAGNIGRGFIGKLLAESDAEVTFADANTQLVDQLNHSQEYHVRVVGDNQHTDVIRHIAAVQANSDDVINQIIKADIITTAVGPQVLAKIAATIARGLQLRWV